MTTQQSLISLVIFINLPSKTLTGILAGISLAGYLQGNHRIGPSPPSHDYWKKHYKSCNPSFNITQCNEAVATDIIFSDVPAVDDGSTMAKFFCGRNTLVCDAYGITSTKQVIFTLADNIRKRGGLNTLISDRGSYEMSKSKKVTDLLRSLFIADY